MVCSAYGNFALTFCGEARTKADSFWPKSSWGKVAPAKRLATTRTKAECVLGYVAVEILTLQQVLWSCNLPPYESLASDSCSYCQTFQLTSIQLFFFFQYCLKHSFSSIPEVQVNEMVFWFDSSWKGESYSITAPCWCSSFSLESQKNSSVTLILF